jgi:hypothetical protein
MNNGCLNPQPSASACCNSCSTAGCVAWTFHGSINPAACNVWEECWLKSKTTSMVLLNDDHIVTGIIQRAFPTVPDPDAGD